MLNPELLYNQLLTLSPNRARVDLDALWQAFACAYPQRVAASDSRDKLAELLFSLAKGGNLILPKGRPGWDQAAKPALPKWVQIARSQTTTAKRRMADIPWPPELRFAAELPSSVHMDTLLKIKEWLAKGGRTAEVVPIKERSVEIFGDEKRLDRLLKTELCTEGFVTTELLRCHPVVPDLTWARVPQPESNTMLILENLSTYRSFEKWNAVHQVYALCVYGAGLTIQKTFTELARLLKEMKPSEVLYFGDLDGPGLQIPRQLSEMTAAAGLPLIRPAADWYYALLNVFDPKAVKMASAGTVTQTDLNWLPAEIRTRVSEIFAAGYRVPQELIGWGVLSKTSPAKAVRR